MIRKGKRLDFALAAVAPLLPALLGFFKILNGDIGFHVATGRAIDLAGKVPTTNVLSFAQDSQPWVLHQWLPAYLFHHVDQLVGPAGLVLLKCVVIYVTFLFLWLAMRMRSDSRSWCLFWFTVAAGAAASRFFVRPYLFSMMGVSVLLYLLARYELTDKRAYLLAAAAIVAPFAALHAGVIYLLLIFGAAAAAGFAAWLLGFRPREGGPAARDIGLAFGAALLLTMLVVAFESPWGLESLTLPFRFSTNEYFHQHLVEFRPLPFDLAIYPFAWLLLASVWAMFIVAVWRTHGTFMMLKGRRVMLFELFCLAGFTWLVLKHQRLIFAFAIVAAFLLARWTNVLARVVRGRDLMRRVIAGAAVVVAICALFVQFTSARLGPGVDDRFYPARIFDFVEQHELPDHAYVSDSWGGHWLWKFYPTRRGFYDNRLEAYSFEFFKDVYQSIRYGEEGWQEKLDDSGVNTLVLKYSTPGERRFQEGRPNLRDLAFGSPAWCLVFYDDIGMVLVRRDPRFCTGCPEYAAFNPDTLSAAPGVSADKLAAELNRAWEAMPSGRTCAALAMWEASQGRRGEAARLLRDGLRQYPGHPLLEQVAANVAGGTP